VRIPHAAAGWPASVPALDGEDVLRGWRAVTAGVHAQGAGIAAQLWHQGAQREVHDDDLPEQLPVSPSGRDTLGARVGRALRTDELGALAVSYALAAGNAQVAGFDAVELHGAHGYLLDEFLWDKTNLRTDAYGGSIRARTRFPAEVVAAVRAAVGADCPIIYRFSQWKANHYDARIASIPAELEALLAPLVDAGVDVFHPSTRRHWLPAFSDGVGADAELSLPTWKEGQRAPGDRGRIRRPRSRIQTRQRGGVDSAGTGGPLAQSLPGRRVRHDRDRAGAAGRPGLGEPVARRHPRGLHRLRRGHCTGGPALTSLPDS
jgi:2,4-dienoyl-CoA reductase-like NADH-dependent reductase (Old Yellow Enzyme family)